MTALINGAQSGSPTSPATSVGSIAVAEAGRLTKIEERWLHLIQTVVFGGVILLTVGAGALSWSHLTHIAASNGHIAPAGLVFLFPTIIDGFMMMSSGVVVRHALTDELGGRTWYAGILAAATAALSVCLNIQDSTGTVIIPAWMLPGIAPTLYMLGTELGLTELRLLMRKLRGRIQAATPPPPADPAPPSKKELVLSALAETDWQVPAALAVLDQSGVTVDRSYVYEIRRTERGRTATLAADEAAEQAVTRPASGRLSASRNQMAGALDGCRSANGINALAVSPPIPTDDAQCDAQAQDDDQADRHGRKSVPQDSSTKRKHQ